MIEVHTPVAAELRSRPVDEVLASIWRALPENEGGDQTGKFEVAGRPLLATRFLAKIREVYGVGLRLRDLYDACSLISVAERVEAALQATAGSPPPLEPAGQDGPFVVSFAQRRLWFVHQLDPTSSTYNIPHALRVRGMLDVPALERALDGLARRHQPLRTVFAEVDGEPVQIVRAPSRVTLPLFDLRALNSLDRARRTGALAAEEAVRPFDLASGPLMRASLLQVGDDEHVILFTLHHIVTDAWSMEVLVGEMSALYASYSAGRSPLFTDLSMQYVDYAVWQRGWFTGAVLEAELAHWRSLLAGAPPLLDLPTDRTRPASLSSDGRGCQVILSPVMTDALRRLSRREGATLFMTLLAAFQASLSRWSGEDDLLIGTPVAGRTRPETVRMIGFFVNTLVIRGDLSGDPPFRTVVRRVRERVLEAHAHQDLPFERLVEDFNVERSLGHTPLYQVNFAFHAASRNELTLGNLELEALECERDQVNTDLDLTLFDEGERIAGTLAYRTDLFDAATVTAMVGHFVRLVEAVSTDPERPLSRVELLDEDERRHVVEDWNATSLDLPFVPVHLRFEAQAARMPHSPAVVSGTDSMSYAELDRRANQIAHHLVAQGAGLESPVGILLEPTPELIAAVLGTLKAGAAYVPLDPSHPAARTASVLADSGASVLITHSRYAAALPPVHATVVRLDADAAEIEAHGVERPAVDVGPDALAYAIYTSGSTGTPKAVLIEHRNLSNYLAWFCREVLEDGRYVLPFVSRPTFDASMRQLFAPLVSGSSVWVLTAETLGDPIALLREVGTREKVVFSGVPSLWSALLDSIRTGGAPAPEGLAIVMLGGEVVSPALVERTLATFPEVRIFNLYGPTEATVNTSVCRIMDPAEVTIGRPVGNVRVYILDRHLQPVPPVVAGELFIGGAGVGRGYLGRSDLTAERFLPDPFSRTPGARMYRSGDRARWRPDGRIAYMGRVDFQVKVRGFRVEPGEVEAVLATHPAVREAVVLARADPSGDVRLVGYVVPVEGEEPTSGALRGWLEARLPGHMVPTSMVVLEAWPRAANGKVDRTALPVPQAAGGDQEAPSTETERIIASIWTGLLHVERVGVFNDFFSLGGHSLLAMQVISRVRSAFHVDLPLRVIFEARTVASLAKAVEAAVLSAARDDEVARVLLKLEAMSEEQARVLLSDD